jgi:hypothetical protein
MATRTIASPGVQINELDLSIISSNLGGTDVFITGFTKQGPTDEIINVTSVSELVDVFGEPENAAERYSFHSCKKVLDESGNLLFTRMPYGSGAGLGFANSYSALVFPLSSNNSTYENSTEYRLLEPRSILLNTNEYEELVQNNIVWDSSFSDGNITSFNDISKAGLVVINASKTTVNNLFEGYYIGLADNSNNNPATDFNSVTGIKAANATVNNKYQTFINVPTSRLSFSLTSSLSSYGSNSISEVVDGFPTAFDFGSSFYNDSLTLALFKIRPSIYNQDTITLDYTTVEGYTGSLNSNRTQNDVNGGSPKSFYLENTVNLGSFNLKLVVNPHISTTGNWLNNNGVPNKTVRVENKAKNLYSIGVFGNETDRKVKDVGNIPQKIQRVLRILENADDVNIDIIPEAGLGTIWVGAKARKADPSYSSQPQIFDDNYFVDINVLKSTDGSLVGGVRDDYLSVINQFVSFAQDVKRNHIFLSDGLRYIFVNGKNFKTFKSEGFIFSKDIYWPLRNLYAGVDTSYAAAYGNWVKVNDVASDSQVWLPVSGFVAGKMVSTDRNSYPWQAVAGFNRGTLTGISDIGITTNQKQRDLLYKSSINPIAFFPSDGIVIYGQKTLFKKPSAFDRINVRRLFLTLEKRSERVLKFFLFEPNTFSTRTRLIGSLTPIFEEARLNDGLYDYQIVCNETNNTPDVIDNNELKVATYIQAVRTGEYILAQFVSTKTGVSFEEIIAG